MSDIDLPRLLDDGDDADAFLRRVLESGRLDAPSPRALQKAPAAVAALVAAQALSGTAAAAVTGLGTKTTALVVAKWLAAGALLGTSLSVVVPVVFETETAPMAPLEARSATAATAATAPPRRSLETTALGAAVASARAGTVATPEPARAAAPTADLRREIALLDAARRELERGEPRRSLDLLRSLERLPRRSLVPEATVLRVRALLARGDRAEATRIAESFARTAPNAPQSEVLLDLVRSREKLDPN